MASGFKVGTKDLDDIFDPYVEGTKPAATGFKVGTQDLRDRYAPRALGAQAAATGMKVGSADLNTLFAAKGTAMYQIAGLHGSNYSADDQALTSQSSVYANVALSMKNDGTWVVTGGTSRGPTAWSPHSGTWLPAGASVSDYEVQFVVSATGVPPATLTNGASAYSNLGTTRQLAFQLPTAGGTSPERYADATVTVNLRRVGGTANASSFTINLFTAGFR